MDKALPKSSPTKPSHDDEDGDTFKWPYLNILGYWIAESTTPIQATYISSEEVGVEVYMYVLDVQGIKISWFGFAFFTGFVQTLAGHSGVKGTVTLSNDAVAVICRFMYSSDADGVNSIVQEQQ